MIGYRLDMVEITDPEVLRASGQKFHPIVSPTGMPADEVAGQVFRITPAELAAADDYEVSDYSVLAPLKSGRKPGCTCARNSAPGARVPEHAAPCGTTAARDDWLNARFPARS